MLVRRHERDRVREDAELSGAHGEGVEIELTADELVAVYERGAVDEPRRGRAVGMPGPFYAPIGTTRKRRTGR